MVAPTAEFPTGFAGVNYTCKSCIASVNLTSKCCPPITAASTPTTSSCKDKNFGACCSIYNYRCPTIIQNRYGTPLSVNLLSTYNRTSCPRSGSLPVPTTLSTGGGICPPNFAMYKLSPNPLNPYSNYFFCNGILLLSLIKE